MKKNNFNWGLVLTLFCVSLFWLFLWFVIYQFIVLKGQLEIYNANKDWETVMEIKRYEFKIAMFRDKYGIDKSKVVKEIMDICKETKFEWKLAVAIARQETQLGEKVVGKNNLYNIKRTENIYRNYNTTRDSILDFINLLNTSYYYKEFQISRKLDDLFRYAEDPLWELKVRNIMNTL